MSTIHVQDYLTFDYEIMGPFDPLFFVVYSILIPTFIKCYSMTIILGPSSQLPQLQLCRKW